MRERLAMLVCVTALVVALGLPAIFAWRNNSGPTKERNPIGVTTISNSVNTVTPQPNLAALPLPTADVDQGKTIFDAQKCATCHSIGGSGNPRHPLDGIGTKLTYDQFIEWTTGTGSAASHLPQSIRQRKARYAALKPEERNLLWKYVSSIPAESSR